MHTKTKTIHSGVPKTKSEAFQSIGHQPVLLLQLKKLSHCYPSEKHDSKAASCQLRIGHFLMTWVGHREKRSWYRTMKDHSPQSNNPCVYSSGLTLHMTEVFAKFHQVMQMCDVWQLIGGCTHPVGTLGQKVCTVTLPIQGFKARASPLATNRQLPQPRNKEPVIQLWMTINEEENSKWKANKQAQEQTNKQTNRQKLALKGAEHTQQHRMPQKAPVSVWS